MLSILGLSYAPWGMDASHKLCLSLSHLFFLENQAIPDSVEMPYLGAVAYLDSADNYATLHWVVRNLPVSNHDHGVNGLEFTNDGTLLIAIGGQTNGGWPHAKLGGLEEAYFSGAINGTKVGIGVHEVTIAVHNHHASSCFTSLACLSLVPACFGGKGRVVKLLLYCVGRRQCSCVRRKW